MAGRSARRWTFGAAALCLAAIAPAAQAQDFFSQLFGGFGRGRIFRMPFDDGYAPPMPQVERPRYSGGQAYCVRTCYGR